MPISADYIVVGSGLTGATIARQLFDAGREVLVVEKRDHVAGNCYDFIDAESGIRMNAHGPHYFRTSSEEIWEYARRFAAFRKFEAHIKSCVDGKIYSYPVTMDMIHSFVGPAYQPDEHAGENSFEGECLTKMPRIVYDKFVRGYTEKQWGKPATELSAGLASRVEVRAGKDRRLSTKKYQGVPVEGYTHWIGNMLEGIETHLRVDYLSQFHLYQPRKKLIFTGPIDSFLKHVFGELEYRSQRRDNFYYPDYDWMLPACQINYPSPRIKIIREIEWKHIWPTDKVGTLITQEMPVAGGEEYPVPDARNADIYTQYRELADSMSDTVICGRLGENRYLDMDQAIGRAMSIARKICAS